MQIALIFLCVIDELDNTLNVGKNVYVIYGRKTTAEWGVFLDNMSCDDTNAVEESKVINLFLKKHKGITGFLLYGIEPDVIIHYYCLNTYNKTYFGKTIQLYFILNSSQSG